MFREITMQDIRELLRRHEAGHGGRKIARELGVDRKTVGRCLDQAEKLDSTIVTDEVALAVGKQVQARPPVLPSQAW
jgi:response regulator of citrate/malate metabolism